MWVSVLFTRFVHPRWCRISFINSSVSGFCCLSTSSRLGRSQVSTSNITIRQNGTICIINIINILYSKGWGCAALISWTGINTLHAVSHCHRNTYIRLPLPSTAQTQPAKECEQLCVHRNLGEIHFHLFPPWPPLLGVGSSKHGGRISAKQTWNFCRCGVWN